MPMKTRTLLLIAGLAGAALPAVAQTEEVQYDMIEVPTGSVNVLDDPEWQKRFLGSYGFRSALEPKVNQEEVALLGDLIELMKANASAAAEQLQGQINDSSSPALIFILANLYFQDGKLEQAQKYYQMAVDKHPDFLRARKNLGLLYMQKQDFDNALKHLSTAIALGESDGRTNGLIGFAYLSGENYLAAESAYRDAIQMEPDVADWQLGLARTLLATERYGEAASLFDTLIKANPDDPTLWLLQSNAYLGLNQPVKAAVNLETVRGMGAPKRESLLLLGDIYLNLEMPESALEVYQQALGEDETGAGYPAALRAAKLLQQTGAVEESNELIEDIKSQYASTLTNDQQLELLTIQAKIARRQGDQERAVALLKDIVKKDGTKGDALIELADYYSSTGNEEDMVEAVLYIEKATNLQDYEYQALVKHAQILTKQKKYAQAANLLKRALTIKQEPRIERFLAQVERAAKS